MFTVLCICMYIYIILTEKSIGNREIIDNIYCFKQVFRKCMINVYNKIKLAVTIFIEWLKQDGSLLQYIKCCECIERMYKL